MSKFRQLIPVLLLRLFGFLPLSFLRWAGAVLGRCAWVFNARESVVTRQNLALCFPEYESEKRIRLARESLIHTAITAFEMGPIWCWSNEQRSKKVLNVHGLEKLQSAIDFNKGVLVIAPHLGNWEMLAVCLAKQHSTMVMYKRPDNPYLHELIYHGRTDAGIELAPTTRAGVSAVLKALKQGCLVGVLPDQVPEEPGGIYAPFFGQQAYSMTLVSNLIKKTDCRVICAYAQRVDDGFDVHFKHVEQAAYSEDLQESVSGLNLTMENCIRLIPEQYQWEYKRFKKREDGERKFYNNAPY